MWFKKNKEDVAEKVADKLEEWTEKVENKVEPEPVKPAEEWMWVEGYKATDKDMKCRDYQYTLGELHNMPNDAKIEECESGFHLCKDLDKVFEYYNIGDGHRFFKVCALVRKSDYERLGEETKEYKAAKTEGYSYSYVHLWNNNCYYDKLAARSIIFERELTPDEILKDRIDVNEWSDEHKRLALSVGIDRACEHMQADKLVELGYSQTFALLIVNADKYEIAKDVASQPDLSMDMKCWMIFK